MTAATSETANDERIIRLVATDLDGTLLRDDQTVSERTRRALAAAQSLGITIVLVTGRPPRFVLPLVEELGLEGAAICCNGAILLDLATGNIQEHTLLESATALTVVERLRSAEPGVAFAIERGLRYGSEPAYRAMGGMGRPGDDEIATVQTLCAQPVTKLLARHPELSGPAYYPAARELAGDLAMITVSGPRLVEIAALGVNKSAMLARYAARLGVTPAQVIAFGDMPNDAPMLAWAGRGVAVANAHPEARAAADGLTASNMEDGVAITLERLLERM
ncbi:MAG TPA: HAD family hydrolase [Ktedonobacterales bacterium]